MIKFIKYPILFCFLLFLTTICFASGNRDFSIIEIEGTAWQSDSVDGNSCFKFINKNEYVFLWQGNIVHNGNYVIKNNRVLINPLNFRINTFGRQAWLEKMENNKFRDDRGNIYQLIIFDDYLTQFSERTFEPIEVPHENQNHLIVGTEWISQNTGGMRVLYQFNENELTVYNLFGRIRVRNGRFPYVFYNGNVFLNASVFGEEYTAILKIMDDKLYRENGDIYNKAL